MLHIATEVCGGFYSLLSVTRCVNGMFIIRRACGPTQIFSCKQVEVSLGNPQTAFEEQAAASHGSFPFAILYACVGEYETQQSDLHHFHVKAL